MATSFPRRTSGGWSAASNGPWDLVGVLLVAGVTSAVLIRGEAPAEQIERTRKQRDIQTLNEASTQIQQAIARLGKHLDNFESRGGAS